MLKNRPGTSASKSSTFFFIPSLCVTLFQLIASTLMHLGSLNCSKLPAFQKKSKFPAMKIADDKGKSPFFCLSQVSLDAV